MNILENAILFATKAHEGATRKDGDIPYILHPLEAAGIASTLTNDLEILAATVLHDVVEDTEVTMEDLHREFGDRVASLVGGDSEDKREGQDPQDTWKVRKQETIDYARSAPREEKIVMMADKLSNLRAIYRDYLAVGDKLWERFHVKNPQLQVWYYASFLEPFADFQDKECYAEFKEKILKLKEMISK